MTEYAQLEAKVNAYSLAVSQMEKPYLSVDPKEDKEGALAEMFEQYELLYATAVSLKEALQTSFEWNRHITLQELKKQRTNDKGA